MCYYYLLFVTIYYLLFDMYIMYVLLFVIYVCYICFVMYVMYYVLLCIFFTLPSCDHKSCSHMKSKKKQAHTPHEGTMGLDFSQTPTTQSLSGMGRESFSFLHLLGCQLGERRETCPKQRMRLILTLQEVDKTIAESFASAKNIMSQAVRVS